MRQMYLQSKRWVWRLLAVAGLLIFYALALDTALQKSPTSDEPAHFVRGFVLWQTGDLHLQFEHAPLSHWLLGLFLQTEPAVPAVQQLRTWPTGDRLQIAAELLWETAVDVDRLFFLARLPIIWLGLLLGALLASWAWASYGRYAMLTVLTLFTFSPNLLAHATLATTDLPLTVMIFATVYGWWRYWQNLSWGRWLFTALFLGLALATKLTAVLLLPLLFILSFVYWRRGQPLWPPILRWLGLLPLAGLVLWALYGFELGPFNNLTLPAATYWQSWRDVLTHVDSGHQAFFLGELANDGWWSYFAVTFLLKTPLVTLLLLVVSIVITVRRRALWPMAIFLLLPAAVFFMVATVSRLNIGYRHILPALPFLLLFCGTAVAQPTHTETSRSNKPRIRILLVVVGLAWLAVGSLRQHPHHLAYFSELVGGTANGYRYLGDSNLDWGQDLRLLADTIAKTDAAWRVAYFGAGDPQAYGLPAPIMIAVDEADETFAAANPAAGRYALSVNHLHGLLPDADLFDWFRRQAPVANLGGSILVYEVAAQNRGQWIAHCLDPGPLFTPQEAEQLLGQADKRHLWFDCRQSWLFAQAGTPGWLIVPQGAADWVKPAVVDGDIHLQLVYRHAASTAGPSYEVYYWTGGQPQLAARQQDVIMVEGTAVTLPTTLADTIQLNSYHAAAGNWDTLWQATAVTTAPLSLQAHLYGQDGRPLVADGLGFSSGQWQPGDLFLQRHHFDAQADGVFMETGLVNYATAVALGERLRLPGQEKR